MESDHGSDIGTKEVQDFHSEFYVSLTRWGDALLDLAEVVPFASGPVSSTPALSLEAVFRHSHGSLYKALANGRIDIEQGARQSGFFMLAGTLRP